MADAIRLRDWQRAALEKLESCTARDFLAVATPGAGKTTFALTAVRRALARRQAGRVMVVVPTQHLKQQWANAADRFGIHLDPDWSSGDGVLPSDVHGAALTYQQVAANPGALRKLARGAFTVLDEIHHAADSRAWGDGVRHAFEVSALRLCLSGTPFRSDQSTIPFVRYRGELAEADYEYGYAEALEDAGVVRPIYFPRIGGRMEWTAPDGRAHEHSFDDPIARTLASQRLRTALSLEGEWMPAVLSQAHRQLEHLRRRDRRAGGMVIAMDQDHARGIARIMRDLLGERPVLATSDDPQASRRISEYSEGSSPWIVAVRMVSEGVDIPRLRVGVYASNTGTDLFFRQAVGRLVRHSGASSRQTAYMFIPDDPRLRGFAHGIAEQRRHSLRKPERDALDDRLADEQSEDERASAADEQLSLFSALSAVPLDEHGNPLDPTRVVDVGADEEPEGPSEDFVIPDHFSEPEVDPSSSGFALEVQEAEELASIEVPAPAPVHPSSLRSRKKQLRELNSAVVRALVRSKGRSHADVNAELNRRAGIRRVTEASQKELERRLEMGEAWLRQG